MKIGIIGAGKVGHSLGRYIVEQFASKSLDFPLAGYFSKSISSAEEAAAFTGADCSKSLQEIIDSSDIVFITVPDGAIIDVWNDIIEIYKDNPFEDSKLFCHCSGSLTSAVFHDSAIINALVCSLHPMYAVSDKHNTYKELPKAYFTFEGSDEAYSKISGLLDVIGNHVSKIPASNKTLYHAACVFFSNLVVGLAKNGENILLDCGLDTEFAQNAWRALFLDNANHVSEKGPDLALTGPAERGDISTIKSHINEFIAAGNTDMLTTYCILTKSIVEIAKQRHPDRDYSEILALLDSSLA